MTEENDDTEIEAVEVEEIETDPNWRPPIPKTPNEKLYARLAMLWRGAYDDRGRELRIANGRIQKLEVQLEREKTTNSLDHQSLIQTLGDKRQLVNEADGTLRRETFVQERVSINLMSLLASVKKVTDAISPQKGTTKLRITMEVVFLACFGMLIWQLAVNPEFRSWMTENMIWFVLLAGFFAFMFWRWREGKKTK